jgi:very-short-patch-repair endonuclease
VVEHRFHPERRWRFDIAWPDLKVAVEVEGGVFVRGRHNRPTGFINDCEKYNAAAVMGWRVLRFPARKGWVDEAMNLLLSLPPEARP